MFDIERRSLSSKATSTSTDFLVLLARVVLASVWLYNGLWLKVMVADAHHLAIVTALGTAEYIQPVDLLTLIGYCETLLAAGILSGLYFRFVSYFQVLVLLLMNILGIIFGGGNIANPAGLIVSNLPTIMCCLFIAKLGPGGLALTISSKKDNSNEEWH